MAILATSHLTFHFGETPLLTDVTLELEPGRKIGVVGRNGTGKSTFLRILCGQIEPLEGRVTLQRGISVAYQEQEMAFAPGATVYEEMKLVFAKDLAREERLEELGEELAQDPDETTQKRLLSELQRLQEEHVAAGGYEIDRQIAAVLSRLGLPEEAWHQPIEQFSGGERNVIGLARVLLARPEVMLLDEPSNHLDMDGVEWFIDFIRSYGAAVIMVSHNRHLLDACIDEIWEVVRGRVDRWTGNYSDYQRQKAEALALQERQYKSQQRLIQRLEFQARRLRDMARAYDDPGQAKRAKSMLRRIEHMDKVESPETEARTFSASIGGARHGRIALDVRNLNLSYGDRVLLEKIRLEIEYGDRVCLVGPNGSGKTTLFRAILDEAAWENPILRLGKSVKVGCYTQLHDESLPSSMTLLDWAHDMTRLPLQAASELLHRFRFTREDLGRPIRTLSGGEKSRLQLARLSHEEVNFLLLDEPTNHLDIPSCEQLEEMLDDFQGTLFVISHDRYFLDRLVNRVVEVEDRRLVLHRQSFADWWHERKALKEPGRKAALELRSRKSAAEDAKDAKKVERAVRKGQQRDQRRLRQRQRSLEKSIERTEAHHSELEAQLAVAFADGHDPREAQALTTAFAQAGAELEKLYEEWERVASAVES